MPTSKERVLSAIDHRVLDRIPITFDAEGVVYDEVGTNRTSAGVNEVLILWKSWADAFPDIQGTFESVHVSGNRVVLEITWRGTHKALCRREDGAA